MNRRSFLRTSALATAGAFTARSYSQISGANERVRVGIIGFGLIGRIHARSFHGLKESPVVAVSELAHVLPPTALENIFVGERLQAA